MSIKYKSLKFYVWPNHPHLRSNQRTKGHKGRGDMAHGIADSPNLKKIHFYYCMGGIGCISDGLYDGLNLMGLYMLYIIYTSMFLLTHSNPSRSEFSASVLNMEQVRMWW